MHTFPTDLLAVIPCLAGSAPFAPFRLHTFMIDQTTFQVWLIGNTCGYSVVQVLDMRSQKIRNLRNLCLCNLAQLPVIVKRKATKLAQVA
jgi:hypothetical protein